MTKANLSIAPLDDNTDNEKTAKILKETKANLGFIPNLYAYMGHSEGLIATYKTADANFRKLSDFTPIEQEIVYLAISAENECDYCLRAHSMIATKMSKVPQEIIDNLLKGQEIDDQKLYALFKFTQLMVKQRGWVEQSELDAFKAEGFKDKDVLDIILAIGTKTLSNYMNHLTHTPVDAAFQN